MRVSGFSPKISLAHIPQLELSFLGTGCNEQGILNFLILLSNFIAPD